MKIVYMGTPDFAVPSLEKLIECGHQVNGVITQPDKPKGRGKAMAFSPVKEAALAHNIPVYTPAKINTPEGIMLVESLEADVIVVNSCTVTAATYQKTRQAVRPFKRNNPDSVVVLTCCLLLVYPEYVINVHPSAL